MKKKAGAFLLTILLAISTVAPVYAAENIEPLTTVNASYTGNYNVVLSGLTCFCQFNSARSVTAGTALSNVTVTINSRAYSATGASIGSNGNAGVGSTSTSYSTTDDIEYCINVHSAPNSDITANITVYR